jgi:hypothetical protein
MRLRITAPDALVSNQATFELTCLSQAVYIYRTDLTLAQQYKQLLDPNGFDFDIIKVSSILATNFDSYKLILIGPDTGSGSSWGDSAGTQAQKVEDAGKPVVGLGNGGYAFFGKLGSPIGFGEGWGNSGRDVYVMNTSDTVWNRPNDISIPGSHIVQLYHSNSSFIAIYYPNPIAGIVGIGRQSNNATHYQIIEKDVQQILWGFDAGPQAMTTTGKEVFVNTARSAMQRRLFILEPVLIAPVLEFNP